MALPGVVDGGLIASLVDCRGIGTAADAVLRAAGKAIGEVPSACYVTVALHVDFLKPTPLGPVRELRGQVQAIPGRKITVVSRSARTE